MVDKGLPVEILPAGNGQRSIAWDVNAIVMWVVPDRAPMSSGDIDSAEWERFALGDDSRYRLVVNGVDYSPEFEACHIETEYDEFTDSDTSAVLFPNDDFMRKQVSADNRWAQCARDNGWSEISDVSPPGQGEPYPMVLLPMVMTVDQLVKLLADCPLLNPDQEARIDSVGGIAATDPNDLPDWYVPNPSVGIDYPGFNGQLDMSDQSGHGFEHAQELDQTLVAHVQQD